MKNILKPTRYNILKAAAIIKRGGIVAFPTETVYGLGASAFDATAVKKIFKAKGRPSDNPLIVHIGDKSDLSRVITNITSSQDVILIKMLTDAFWPGPLTLILPRNKNIPSIVSAGLQTVAVRMPAHKAALALIKATGVPIAAPSANLSGRPSPTTAEHVVNDLGRRVSLILDGGKTKIGLESTVLDLTAREPVILRQGAITFEALKKIIPNVRRFERAAKGAARSPGMKYRHYAPKTPLLVAKARGRGMLREVLGYISKNPSANVGVLATRENAPAYARLAKVLVVGSGKNLAECAGNLFTRLREFDKMNLDVIIAEPLPERGIGAAIMDKLRRAAQN